MFKAAGRQPAGVWPNTGGLTPRRSRTKPMALRSTRLRPVGEEIRAIRYEARSRRSRLDAGPEVGRDVGRFEGVVRCRPAEHARDPADGQLVRAAAEVEAVRDRLAADLLDRDDDVDLVLEAGRLEIVAADGDAREAEALAGSVGPGDGQAAARRKAVSAASIQRKKLVKWAMPAMSVSPNSTRRRVTNGSGMSGASVGGDISMVRPAWRQRRCSGKLTAGSRLARGRGHGSDAGIARHRQARHR